jgi:hypothetical protein
VEGGSAVRKFTALCSLTFPQKPSYGLWKVLYIKLPMDLWTSEIFPDRIAIYGPVIFTAQYVMLLMRANPLLGQVGGGWALEILMEILF